MKVNLYAYKKLSLAFPILSRENFSIIKKAENILIIFKMNDIYNEKIYGGTEFGEEI